MSAGLFIGEEETGGFDDDFGADFVPLQSGRILLGGEADLLAVDDEEVAVDRDVVVEDAVDGVILQHVREVVRVEQVVDADDFDVIREVFDGGTEHHAANSSESVDTDFDSHCFFSLEFVVKARNGFSENSNAINIARF